MGEARISHVVGFDDAPFERDYRGNVLLVGAVFAGQRLEGVLSGKVRRDGANATHVITEVVARSRFASHLQLVMLQGIAFAGFNVVDIHALHAALGVPVLVVMRRQPDIAAIRRALSNRVPGGARKWRLIERAGPIEEVGKVFVQRAGIDHAYAVHAVKCFAVNSDLPEPLRTAHLIAGGVQSGESRHRA